MANPEPLQVGPNGEIGIWTGTGYDYSAPTSFDDSALVGEMRTPQAAGYYSGDSGPPDMGPATMVYGLDAGGQGWSPMGDNYQLQYDPNVDPNKLNLQIKSGDKQGTTVPYVKDPASGKWVMDGGNIRSNFWDTNTLKRSWMMAMPIAVGAGAFLAAGALGATGAAAGGGAGGAAGGAGAATGAGGMTAADYAAAYGTASALDGSAGAITAAAPAWGTTGAAYIPGTAATAGFTPGAGIVAGEMSGAMAAPAVGNAASSSWWDLAKKGYDYGSKALEVYNKIGGQPAPVGESGDYGQQPLSETKPQWRNPDVNFNKIGTAVGKNKPGAVPVPEFDPNKVKPVGGTVGGTFNFGG